ncbi:MAG: ferredoxin family protein [Kiritimatiellales bacterium]|nr:ferredoxin family protein [Kiritimatiellales bacterium]
MSENNSILVCKCAERGLLSQSALEPLLQEEGMSVVPDLCKAAAEKLPMLGEIAAQPNPKIYACHPRAVRALFVFAGFPLPENTEIINLRDPASQTSDDPSMESNPAWYPVIDTSRCSNCGQCFEFCLFGVYEKDGEGRVKVVNPQSCKNNCPACARICPEAAIIFPKIGEEPINGAEIVDEKAVKENIRVNVDEILGDDVYATLAARKQKRRKLLDKKKIEKALAERKTCSGKKK